MYAYAISHFIPAYMKYYDNPGGMIPTWLINWGAKVSNAIPGPII